MALSCERYPAADRRSWRDALRRRTGPSPAAYAAGGWLVGYLLRMFPGRLRDTLYGNVQINATADEFAQVFEDIYEMPIDDVWAAAISVQQAPMHCPWECARPAFAADGRRARSRPLCGAAACS